MKEHTSLIKKKFIFEKSNEGFLINMALKSLLSKKTERLTKLQIYPIFVNDIVEKAYVLINMDQILWIHTIHQRFT